MSDQRLTRRTLMAVTGVGAAAVTGAALGVPPAARAAADGAPSGGVRQFVDAILGAFRWHRVVAIGEVHGQQAHHDALLALLTDPRLPGLVDDIVVEFGNALYQPTMDRFTSGLAVQDRDLRLVWRNTTQSPVSNWDAPMYEQFYRTVRAVNWALPAERRIRVLLGDPPVDWSRVRTPEDLRAFEDRDGHLVEVIKREVLANKGRRALILYGSNHVMHAPPGAHGGGGIAHLEEETGQRAYVILDGGHPRLASSPRPVLIPAAGTWLASADSAEFNYLPGRCGVPFGALADALLYLGQVGEQTQSLWNPAIYLDPVYWAELQRRNAILGNPIDLDKQFRREQSVVWPTPLPSDC